MPKVALFIPNLEAGGAERVTVLLANGLAERGYCVHMVLTENRGDFLDDLGTGVRVVNLASKGVLRAIPRLATYLRRERPQVLLSALDHANAAAIAANWLSFTKTPVVAAVHAPRRNAAQYGNGISGRLLRFAVNWMYRRAHTVICVSKGVAEEIIGIGVPCQRVRVIYNPVVHQQIYELARQPVEHHWFVPGTCKTLLAVGRLAPQKGLPMLLRALRTVRERDDIRLTILGEGGERVRLEVLVKELGLESCVCMPGLVKNPYAYMAHADLFVLPSAWEALPTVLIEALAVGARVVATDCISGPREILQGGRYGTLVPVGDAAALAAAITAALQAPRHASACSETPPEAVRPYTVERAVDEYCRMIGEVTLE
jgi:glycosyltransferase involved in cell wall biosynthesis